MPLSFAAGPAYAVEKGAAVAQDDWKKEFDDTCQIFEDTEQLGKDELQRLIRRCDNLKLRIEKLEDPHRKVMLNRLKRCRDFYTYLLDIKESEKK